MEKANLPQVIAEEIRANWGEDGQPRVQADVINAVADSVAKREDVITAPNLLWMLKTCIRAVYLNVRHSGRPSAESIEQRQQAEDGGARVLPGWEELLQWPIRFDDGTELPAAHATLAQIEFGSGRYLKLGRENTVKGQFLGALGDAMRTAGMRADQTVAEFYRKSA